MALPLSLGYLGLRIDRAARNIGTEWHSRLLWLSSSSVSQAIMAAAGIAVMGLALTLTLSRSGIGALAVALAVAGWFAVRRIDRQSWQVAVVGLLLVFGVLLLGWVGVDIVGRRFAEGDWGEINGRSGAWADAMATLRRYWLTGTGLNTYQIVNLFYQRHDLEYSVNAVHNDYLQLAAEGGLLVVVPALLCVAIFVRDVRRRFREDGRSSSYWLRAGAVVGLIAIALQETVDFSLQIPANAALFALTCAIALHRSPRQVQSTLAPPHLHRNR